MMPNLLLIIIAGMIVGALVLMGYGFGWMDGRDSAKPRRAFTPAPLKLVSRKEK